MIDRPKRLNRRYVVDDLWIGAYCEEDGQRYVYTGRDTFVSIDKGRAEFQHRHMDQEYTGIIKTGADDFADPDGIELVLNDNLGIGMSGLAARVSNRVVPGGRFGTLQWDRPENRMESVSGLAAPYFPDWWSKRSTSEEPDEGWFLWHLRTLIDMSMYLALTDRLLALLKWPRPNPHEVAVFEKSNDGSSWWLLFGDPNRDGDAVEFAATTNYIAKHEFHHCVAVPGIGGMNWRSALEAAIYWVEKRAQPDDPSEIGGSASRRRVRS